MASVNSTYTPLHVVYTLSIFSLLYFFGKNARSIGLFSKIKHLPSFSFFLFLSIFVLMVPMWESDQKTTLVMVVLISTYLASFIFVGLTPYGDDFDKSLDDLVDASSVAILIILLALTLSFIDTDRFSDNFNEILLSIFVGQLVIKSISAILKSRPAWSDFPLRDSVLDLFSKIWIVVLVYCFLFPILGITCSLF